MQGFLNAIKRILIGPPDAPIKPLANLSRDGKRLSVWTAGENLTMELDLDKRLDWHAALSRGLIDDVPK
jgi:hypothetical protein